MECKHCNDTGKMTTSAGNCIICGGQGGSYEGNYRYGYETICTSCNGTGYGTIELPCTYCWRGYWFNNGPSMEIK